MIFKQFAVGIGIAILLPMFVYYGASLLSPPADWSSYYQQNYYRQKQDAKTPAEKKKISKEKEQRRKALDAVEKQHQRMVFFVAYPVGILAIIGGAFLTVPAVGAGLMFGGILTLTTGCTVYWSTMTDALHFGAVVIALGVLISLGLWKIRPQ